MFRSCLLGRCSQLEVLLVGLILDLHNPLEAGVESVWVPIQKYSGSLHHFGFLANATQSSFRILGPIWTLSGLKMRTQRVIVCKATCGFGCLFDPKVSKHSRFGMPNRP